MAFHPAALEKQTEFQSGRARTTRLGGSAALELGEQTRREVSNCEPRSEVGHGLTVPPSNLPVAASYPRPRPRTSTPLLHWSPMRVPLVGWHLRAVPRVLLEAPPHRAPDGADRKATLALASPCWLCCTMQARRSPTSPSRSTPHPELPQRLSTATRRRGRPPELLAQFDPAEDAVRALGMAVWSVRDFEPTTRSPPARRGFAADVEQVRILTPDKDLGQCLRGTHVVQVDWRAKVRRRRGGAAAPARSASPSVPGPSRADGSTMRTASRACRVRREERLGPAGEVHPPGADPGRPATWPMVRQAPRLAATLERIAKSPALRGWRRCAPTRPSAPLEEPVRRRARDRFSRSATRSHRRPSQPAAAGLLDGTAPPGARSLLAAGSRGTSEMPADHRPGRGVVRDLLQVENFASRAEALFLAEPGRPGMPSASSPVRREGPGRSEDALRAGAAAPPRRRRTSRASRPAPRACRAGTARGPCPE